MMMTAVNKQTPQCGLCGEKLEYCSSSLDMDEIELKPCKHLYHPGCLARWMRSCPLCTGHKMTDDLAQMNTQMDTLTREYIEKSQELRQQSDHHERLCAVIHMLAKERKELERQYSDEKRKLDQQQHNV